MTLGSFGPQSANFATTRPAADTVATGADTFFKDCSSDTTPDGTVVTASWLNAVTAQLRNAARSALGAVDDSDDFQIARAIQSGKLNYAVATGTANAWVVAPALALQAYNAGRILWIRAPATNTNATMTVNISGLGTRPLVKADATPPAIGDILVGRWYPTIDDGTNVCILSSLPSDVVAGLSNSGVALKLNYFEMVTGGTQSVPASSTTVVNDFSVSGSQASDASFGSGGVITIGAKTAGVWSFSMLYNPSQVGGAATTTQAYIYKNGATYLNVTVNGTFCSQAGSVRVAAGDTLSMAVWQNSGGARSNKNAAATPYTFFSLYQISA